MKYLITLIVVALVAVGCSSYTTPTLSPDWTPKPYREPAKPAAPAMTCWEMQGLFDIAGDNWDTTKNSFWIDEMDRWDAAMERGGCY